MHGFISAVIGMYRPSFNWNITLPQKVKTEYHTPTAEEVKAVIEQAKGTEFEIAIRLGCYSLRRSEVLMVTADTLEGNELRISSARVINKRNKYVEKTTKTVNSTRRVPIDSELAEMIRQKGKAYSGHPNSIIRALHRFQRNAGVQQFRFHDLRHFFATELASFPKKDVMYLGGWKSEETLERIYQHSRAEKDAQKREQLAGVITNLLN